MRKLSFVSITLVWLTALMISAQASGPARETIVLTRDNQFREAGWTASGVFTDSGSWTADRFNGDAPNAPTAQVLTTQVSSIGTFSIQFQIVIANNHNQNTWEIIDGTAGFATLHGRGTWTIEDEIDGSRRYILLGEAHFS